MSLEFKKFYKNKSVLVTGATGFKGAYVFGLTCLVLKFQVDLTQIRIKNLFTTKVAKRINLKS